MAANLRPTGQTKTLPAPLGGWNSRDSLAMMAPTDAVTLNNWWPRTSDMLNRRGSTVWATDLPAAVNTLMTYGGTTNQEMYAVSNGAIYDVTTQGAVGSPVMTGLGNSAIQYVNFANAGGSYLVGVNGEDDLILYNGSTWRHLNSLSTPAVLGVDTDKFTQVNLWKRRLFYVEKESMTVWYMPVDSIGGTALPLNFGALFKKGGYIVATATWTLDAGYGSDDNLVIITSRGEVAVYNGTDPDNAATFALIGVYELGSPVSSPRCFVKFGGDLLLITLDGIVPLSKALISTRVDSRVAISDKISGAMTDATTQYQDNFGWQGIVFPKVNMLLFNIPVSPNVEAQQFAMNTLTNAWTKFTGWNANCFELYNDDLYFGSATKVYKAWDGYNDAGAQISCICQQAYNYFDAPAQLKHWKLARPILFANLPPQLSINMDVDFEQSQNYSIPSVTPMANPYGIWDDNIWDNAVWANTQIYKNWQSLSRLGYAGGFQLVVAGDALDCTWPSTDFLYEFGGVI
jgi:hypothetical protein